MNICQHAVDSAIDYHCRYARAHLAMAQPVVTGALFTRRILVKDDRTLSSITWYLNATDSCYHIKGLAKNTLSENRDGIYISINFYDRTTGAYLHGESGSGGEPVPTRGIAPGAIPPFDMDTWYDASQSYQFHHMVGIIE
jgi:hypothetical protein